MQAGKRYKEKWRALLAGYTVPDPEKGAAAGIPVPRLPRPVESASGVLRWKQSVAGQIYNIDVPMQTKSVPITAGGGSASIAVSDTNIPNFAARFGATFYEYCIVGARFQVFVNGSANAAGCVSVYVDEKSATPTATKAAGSPHLSVPITSAWGEAHEIQWKAQDYDDLLWNAIGNTFNSAYVNIFTDATFGTLGTTSCTITVTATFACCFRGIR